MSRVGTFPIPVPNGVDISIDGASVTVTGPKGTLSHELPESITLRREDDTLLVERTDEERRTRGLHGLSRALVANMVTGVTDGFRKDLEIVGVGYRATAKGSDSLELALGYSHAVTIEAPDGITFDVPTPTSIGVIGIDKQVVGQVAANIRAVRKPEPYKGKGVRYAGERVLRKAGKTAK